jgi:hypothetical protein
MPLLALLLPAAAQSQPKNVATQQSAFVREPEQRKMTSYFQDKKTCSNGGGKWKLCGRTCKTLTIKKIVEYAGKSEGECVPEWLPPPCCARVLD